MYAQKFTHLMTQAPRLHSLDMCKIFSSSSQERISAGDFNCPFVKDDKEGGRDLSSKKNVVAEVELLLSSLDLENVWKK